LPTIKSLIFLRARRVRNARSSVSLLIYCSPQNAKTNGMGMDRRVD
jgi:hypothetical protein